jgi:hypothetical protein
MERENHAGKQKSWTIFHASLLISAVPAALKSYGEERCGFFLVSTFQILTTVDGEGDWCWGVCVSGWEGGLV